MNSKVSALAHRLDEVRPSSGVRVIATSAKSVIHDPGARAPQTLRAPILPPRKSIVTYLAVGALKKSRFSGYSKFLFFFLAVVIPTVAGGIYYTFIASPQYVSEFRFSVRPNLGTGSSSTADAMLAMSNSYIVSDYVNSRDAVLALEGSVGLRQHYSNTSADALSRLNSEASIEDLIKYWGSMIHTSYDITTGINIVEVSAFSPDAAQRIAASLKELCERLVNQISDDARQSQMEFARGELERAETRLKDVRSKETVMRADQRTVDARKEADGRLQLNLKLRGELATMQSQYDSLSKYMDPKSPRLTVLKNEIAATRDQVTQLQAQVSDNGANSDTVSSAAITRYDQLQTDLEIANKLYESSLNNYEAARAQANNNQIYLATYVQPNTPETASYPRAAFDTFLIFLSASGVWVVLTLVYYSIRDHV
ncbi:hypothetical protein JZX86_27485 [Agrobacterium rosae]|uniref:hypothetical protein n=1 Tax=Agrobacterium rosae TaxID=1972867 RepID=UPI0019D343B3|nr:hypothetical protein [Agrobacterium rosae]MBN7809066.1 hypothetical protein [Agrobacterium rosae]